MKYINPLFKKTFRWLFCLSLSTALFISCNKYENEKTNDNPERRIELSVGEEYLLEAILLPDVRVDIAVNWTDGDSSVVHLNDKVYTADTTFTPRIENDRVVERRITRIKVSATAKVTAHASGITEITITAGDKTVTWRITVLEGEHPSTDDPGIVIDGIKWATRNVNTPGNFATNPEDFGFYYQWNSRTGWSATGSRNEWNSAWNGGNATIWEPDNDPCPNGWRIPTQEELETLINSGSRLTTLNVVRGRLFADVLFLPAAGYLGLREGTLLGQGGFYWSSSQSSSGYSYLLNFGIGDIEMSDNFHAFGFSCRCVEDK